MSTEGIRRDWAGRAIEGRFTLLQWLGGTERVGVFLTELPDDRGKKAVIKLIAADAGEAEARMAGWAATAALSHPHLMRVFHTGRCQLDDVALVYVVMEDADEVLAEILPERPLTPGEAREMLGPVIDALSYLHGKGFVHGHLKPSNIMVVDDKLKLSGDDPQMAGAAGSFRPAPGVYDAPETAAGTISPAGDLWSLGVTLVVALTQHPPVWDGLESSDPVVPASVPQPFAGIARGCLQPDPARRGTLQDVRARLDTAPPLPAAPGKSGGAASGKRRLMVLVAAAVVLVAVFAFLMLRSNHTQTLQSGEEEQQAPAASTAPPKAQEATPAPPKAQEPSAKAQPQVSAPEGQSSKEPAATTPAPSTSAPSGGALNGAVVEQVLPDVPPSASRTIHGTINVRIRVAVDAGGAVTNATADSEGPSKYFANLALKAAQGWKFKPAQADGQAVPSEWILQFRFTQSGPEVTPVEAAR